ncbi:MAG: DUF2378 family protein [Myxococcaceae bacterium]|nr:DUF2378 family protein [Myxococcaceae bacterium]
MNANGSAVKEERVVFSPSVEALLIRGVAKKMTPELQEDLKQLGIDLSRPLLPGYPSYVWQRAVDHVARTLYPTLSMAEAQWMLGESTVYGFEETLIGKAVIGLSRVIGPRRVLLRFTSLSKSSNNYSTMTLKELAPNDFELEAHPYEGFPEYVQGCLHAVLDVSGAKEPQVDLISHDTAAERIVLRATWKA